jgi:MFS family permease
VGLLIDTTPLRVSRDFRRLWVGQAVSFLGSTMTAAALPFQVYHQTNSSLAVGLLGVAQLGPLVICSIVGGAYADSVDKRRLLLGVTVAALACSGLLAINASLDHPQLWILYVGSPRSRSRCCARCYLCCSKRRFVRPRSRCNRRTDRSA